jgi:hypothetical protein
MLEKRHYESDLGFIDYGYDIDYKPNGLLVFMGSYVYKINRGGGAYKKILRDFLEYFPEGTLIQIPIENKFLIPLFTRMGLEKVNQIEFWGELSGSVLMQGVLTKNTIKSI